MFDILFPVDELYFHTEFPVDVFRYVLGGIDGTVLSAGTAEADGKVGESPFDVALHMGIYQGIDVFQEAGDFSVFFQEADNIFIQSGVRLERSYLPGLLTARQSNT